MSDQHTKRRTGRWLGVYAEFDAKWHRQVRVYESSIAFEGPCVWVGAEKSYAGAVAPTMHLDYDAAVALRDGLSAFIRAADAGETCERKKSAPGHA